MHLLLWLIAEQGGFFLRISYYSSSWSQSWWDSQGSIRLLWTVTVNEYFMFFSDYTRVLNLSWWPSSVAWCLIGSCVTLLAALPSPHWLWSTATVSPLRHAQTSGSFLQAFLSGLPHMRFDVACWTCKCASCQAAKTHQHICTPVHQIPISETPSHMCV